MSDNITAENPRRRLGRGLSALLGGGTPSPFTVETQDHSELKHVATDQITRNPFQPRKEFEPESLKELSDSIREHGILQPILVRAIDGGYQLIAGERRWRAAQQAGLDRVPCRVVDVIDKTAWEFSLEENLKRKDLSDLEKAMAFRDYLNAFQCTVEELAKQLSMNRSTVSNLIRLLDLPEVVKNALKEGKLTAGHARALLALKEEADQLALCGRIQAESMSVRQTEAAVKKLTQAQNEPPATLPMPISPDSGIISAEQAGDAQQQHSDQGDHVQTIAFPGVDTVSLIAPIHNEGQSPDSQHLDDAASHAIVVSMHQTEPNVAVRSSHIDSIEEQLRHTLGVQVEIRLKSTESGSIVIPFNSNDEFESILRQLRRHAA